MDIYEDPKLYTIRGLYERFGNRIPAYQWYIISEIGPSLPHLFTIYRIEPHLSGYFFVELTIMDWSYSKTHSVQKAVVRQGDDYVMVNVHKPPKYSLSSIRGAENEHTTLENTRGTT